MKIPLKVNRDVLHQADLFRDAARLLQVIDSKLHVPFIVNAAFAIELYLKALNSSKCFNKPSEISPGVISYESVTSKPVTWGHSLVDIYDALVEDIKIYLDDEFLNARISADCDSLRDFLSQINKAFVQWRYIFSKDYVRPIELNEMLLALNTLSSAVHALDKR